MLFQGQTELRNKIPVTLDVFHVRGKRNKGQPSDRPHARNHVQALDVLILPGPYWRYVLFGLVGGTVFWWLMGRHTFIDGLLGVPVLFLIFYALVLFWRLLFW